MQIKEGITLSSQTTSKIDHIAGLVKSVKRSVMEANETILDQEKHSHAAAGKIENTKDIFNEVNGLIIQHIEDASIVEEKLESVMNHITIHT